MTVFLDTSGLYAVFDRDDINHARARTAWEDWLREGASLLTNNCFVAVNFTILTFISTSLLGAPPGRPGER